MPNAAFDLARFLSAQDTVYSRVLAELRTGHKVSHWLWFVFPQIAGLGSSATAQHFALGDLEEARAYAAHPILGARLRECVLIVNSLQGRTARQIFGSPDDLKFCSCMTLFSIAEASEPLFRQALTKYYGSEPDLLTLAKLGRV